MAKLTLTRNELASGELPLLCMKCGNTILKPVNKLLVFRPGQVAAVIGACTFIGFGILATGITQVVAFRYVFHVFAFIAFFALRGQVVKIPTRLPICETHREIVIDSVVGENVTLTNISDEFIDALAEQRKNAPAPDVEDIAVGLAQRVAGLPQVQSRWRNLDLPD